jgi:peptide chain release factor
MTTRAALLERLRQLGLQAEDIEESFSRSSGPGGQHVNKVSTACTVRHRPTGISVTASDSRSQHTNRTLAWSRLLERFEKHRAETRQARLADAAKARRQKAKRSRTTKRRLVETKRRRGETKKLRGNVAD